jgi:hypothetical protein
MIGTRQSLRCPLLLNPAYPAVTQSKSGVAALVGFAVDRGLVELSE